MEGSKQKRWRLTEEEFKQKAILYLRNHLEIFTDELEQRVHSNSQCNSLYNMYKVYKQKEYYSIDMEIASILSILEYDIYDWSKFSRDPDSKPEDIMLRLLIGKVYHCDYVCKLFVSANPNLPEEFFEDCIYVNSRFFNFKEWDDEHVSVISDCAAKMQNEDININVIKMYPNMELLSKKISVPFDVIDMCSGKSDAFRNKYKALRERIKIEIEKEEEDLCLL